MVTFDEFVQAIPNENIKSKLTLMIDFIKDNYPELQLVMKWNQPMFVYDKTFIIGFSTAKKHLNVAPEEVALKRFSKEIEKAGYHQTKMLLQIKETQSIDFSLIKDLVEFNIAEKKDMTTFWR